MKTKVDILDTGLRSYMYLVFLVLLFFLCTISLLIGITRSTERLVYDIVLSFFAIIVTAVALIVAISVIYSLFIYNKSPMKQRIMSPLVSCLRVLLNLILSLSMLLKYNKDAVRHFYIHINNIIIRSSDRKYAPENILLLLPHCIQNSECKYRVTNHIENCKKCGGCVIKSIVELKENTGIKVEVATGGTSALKVVMETKPEFVIAVACERDLAAGIGEIRGIPVLGILNERPYGPCKDTNVDLNLITQSLKDFAVYSGNLKIV